MALEHSSTASGASLGAGPRVGSDALLLLGIACRDTAVELAAVGRVCALVLLHVTGALGGRADVLEGRSVDLEGAVGRRARDRDGSRADSAGERVDVHATGRGGLLVGSGIVTCSGICVVFSISNAVLGWVG